MVSEEALFSFLGIKKGITAIIGGGGKTTLLMRLGSFCSGHGSAVLTTSTHIYPPASIPYLRNLTEKLPSGTCVVTGTECADGKLCAPEQSFTDLLRFSDYVIVEADGSKGLPVKAHASHEPVIPKEAETVIAVLGLDAVGQPVGNAVHRHEILCERMHLDANELLTPEILANLLISYPDVTSVVLNKADLDDGLENGRRIARLLPFPVVIISLSSCQPTAELWRNGTCLSS